MRFFYALAISAARCVIPLVARSTKAKAFMQGRKEVWKQLETPRRDPARARVLRQHGSATRGDHTTTGHG